MVNLRVIAGFLLCGQLLDDQVVLIPLLIRALDGDDGRERLAGRVTDVLSHWLLPGWRIRGAVASGAASGRSRAPTGRLRRTASRGS